MRFFIFYMRGEVLSNCSAPLYYELILFTVRFVDYDIQQGMTAKCHDAARNSLRDGSNAAARSWPQHYAFFLTQIRDIVKLRRPRRSSVGSFVQGLPERSTAMVWLLEAVLFVADQDVSKTSTAA